MRLKFLIIISSIFLWSCSSKTSDKVSTTKIINEANFGNQLELEYKVPDGIGKYLIDPKFIDVSDSLMIIRDGVTDENIFRVFKLPEFELIESFGEKGEGPGEISKPAFINPGGFREDDKFEYLDWGRRVLARYSLNQLISEDEATPLREYIMPPEAIRAQRAFFLDDEYIIASGGLSEGKIVKVEISSDSIIKMTPFTPIMKEGLSRRSVGYIYAGELGYNKEKERIAVTTQRFKLLEIYDLNLNLLSDTRFEDQPTTIIGEGNAIASDNTLIHYLGLTFDDDYIYALYSGNNYAALNKAFHGDYTGLKNSMIHVYDWNGNPKIKIQTNTYLSAIAIDTNNNRLIGISPYREESENPIVYFELPTF